jgi:aspartate 1-decarboxylase
MLIKVMKSKIHRATVTRADLNYEGSIAMDSDLLDAAGLRTGEAVYVWNVNNGERFETYALPLAHGSGEICVNGAAARLVQVGDLVIVTAFGWLQEEEARAHEGKVVMVDERNRALKAA